MFIFLIMVISCILLVYYFFCKKEEEIESDEKSNESSESLIRKTSKSSDYVLHFVINIKDSQSIVGENVLVSYKAVPLIKIINDYKPQIITNSTVWVQENQGSMFIVVCGGIIGYSDDKVLLRIPTQTTLIEGKVDLHIVSTSSTLELYINGKPQVFFRIGGMPMIVENIIQGKIVQDNSVGLSVSDDKPIADVVQSEFLPEMDELDFAVNQGAILKGNEIIKKLGRKYAK